jgi:acyl carrier protein
LTSEEIYTQLTEIFQDVFDEPNIVPTAEMSAKDVDGWDSFNHINLILSVEQRFGIKFKTTELESLQNVGHLVGLIQSKLGN